MPGKSIWVSTNLGYGDQHVVDAIKDQAYEDQFTTGWERRMKKYLGKTLKGRVASLHMGNNEDLSKQPCASLMAEIGGRTGSYHATPGAY